MNAMKKLICLLLMLCAGTAAFAWGGREHRLIAYIAEAHLTPRTRQVLDRYLSDSTVNVNLKYVIHLVGEMHCPGHIYFADLPGGMDAPRHYDFFLLKYKGKEVTYHWVWDGSVSRQYPDWTEEDFRRELDKWPAEKQRAVGEGTPADLSLIHI